MSERILELRLLVKERLLAEILTGFGNTDLPHWCSVDAVQWTNFDGPNYMTQANCVVTDDFDGAVNAVHKVGLDTILEGVKALLVDVGDVPDYVQEAVYLAVLKDDDSYLDFGHCDMIVQMGVFGEVRYE